MKTKVIHKKNRKTIREIVPSRKAISNTYSDNTEDKANEFNKLFADVGKHTFNKTQEIIHGENVPYPAPVQENLDGEAFSDLMLLTLKQSL